MCCVISMISPGFHDFNGSLQLCNHANDSNPHNIYAFSPPFVRRGNDNDIPFFRRGFCRVRNYKLSVVCATTPQASIKDHFAPISRLNIDDSKNPSSSKSGHLSGTMASNILLVA